MNNLIKKAYYGAVPFRYRYHKEFADTYDFLMDSQYWDEDRLNKFQFNKLLNLLEHCYQNVPYYRKVFDSLNIIPSDFESVGDLRMLPILTKDIVRDNWKDLIAQNSQVKPITFSTSGSTGTKFKFLGEDSMYKKEAAFVLRAMQSHGATLYDKPSIWLRRYVPEEGEPLFKYDYELKRLYMSAYHITSDNIHTYVETMNKTKYTTLVGYPSSIYILACLMEKDELYLPYIKNIHVASEKIVPKWKEKIEEVLQISVKAHYGQIEKTAFFFQSSDTDMYHEAKEYGVTEFVKQKGFHKVIATSFLNYYMPFIRYDTGDTAILNTQNTTPEGPIKLPHTVVDFEGRTDDILVSQDSRMLPGVNFYTMFYKIDNVKMFKIEQEDAQNINVQLVLFNKKDYIDTVTKVKYGLLERLGEARIHINLVKDIPRDQYSGKIRCIKSNIAI